MPDCSVSPQLREPSAPALEFVAHVSIVLGDSVGSGRSARGARRIVPILGGEVAGPKLRGRVLPIGADYQIVRRDGVAEIEAQYVIETESGARIFVRNVGLGHGTPEAIGMLMRGEAPPPDGFYMRSSPSFETQVSELQWLMTGFFIATLAPLPSRVEMDWFRVG